MRIDAISIGKNPPHDVNVIIEVPVGGEPIKYEMDKEAGTLVVDRFLYTAMRYPGNYGFIPHTLSGDGDPCDVLVANTRAIVPGAVDKRAPGRRAADGGRSRRRRKNHRGADVKADPALRQGEELQRPARHHAAADPAFFEHYKDLEPGKWVKVLSWGDAAEAQKLILEGIERAKGK